MVELQKLLKNGILPLENLTSDVGWVIFSAQQTYDFRKDLKVR